MDKAANRQITRSDVAQAAADQGIGILEALTLMQAAAAKMSDESVLSQLCRIKNEVLFGAQGAQQ